MNVDRYVFQSPSSSKVQIGRPDPSVKQEQNTKENIANISKKANDTLSKAQSFADTQIKDVKPKVSANSIDTYA